jgi:Tfp pilus assembly protein PilN
VTTQTVQTAGVAALPRVNLMPPEIADAQRFRRLQLAMGAAVLLSAVIVGGLYVHAKSGVSSAQADLTSAQAQQAALQTQLTGLDSVKTTYAEVQAKQVLLQQAMGPEIRWSYILNDLSLRIPSNVWMSVIQATESTDDAGPASGTAAPGATAPNYGNILFTGQALAHDDVAKWLDSLAKEKGFSQPSFTGSLLTRATDPNVYTYNSSTLLNDHALSNRYTKAGS